MRNILTHDHQKSAHRKQADAAAVDHLQKHPRISRPRLIEHLRKGYQRSSPRA